MANADVTIAGTDYMIVPKTYKAREEAKTPDAKLARQVLTDFTGGARLGKLLGCACVWPAPWPIGAAMLGPSPVAQTVAGSIAAATVHRGIPDTSYTFVAAGTTLYRWTRNLAVAMVSRKSLPNSTTDVARLRSALYIAYGTAHDVDSYLDSTNTLTGSAIAAGVKAQRIWSWAGTLVLQDPTVLSRITVYYGAAFASSAQFDLAGDVISAAQLGSALVIATDAGIYRLQGTAAGSITCEQWGLAAAQLQSADDYAWMINYQGQLMTWLGRRIVILAPLTDRWLPTGLEGATTYAAAVINGALFVSLTPRNAATTYQLWAYDGEGWWMIDQATGTNPFADLASDGAGHLLTWTAGGTSTRYYDPEDVVTAATLSSPWAITSSLLAAGDPDRSKHWRRIAVELLRPDGQTVGSWACLLEYSTNAGLTWTTAGTTTANASEQTISQAISADAAQLLVRATMTRTSGLPPFVAAIWAEYETLNDSTRRRSWSFDVRATDRTLYRDGTADARTGEQIAAALWSAYASGGTIAFRPPEYGAEAVQYSARFTSLVETWDRTADQSTIGRNSTLAVSLVEV